MIRKYLDEIYKQYVADTVFKDEKQLFGIRKIFYIIKRQRSKI